MISLTLKIHKNQVSKNVVRPSTVQIHKQTKTSNKQPTMARKRWLLWTKWLSLLSNTAAEQPGKSESSNSHSTCKSIGASSFYPSSYLYLPARWKKEAKQQRLLFILVISSRQAAR